MQNTYSVPTMHVFTRVLSLGLPPPQLPDHLLPPPLQPHPSASPQHACRHHLAARVMHRAVGAIPPSQTHPAMCAWLGRKRGVQQRQVGGSARDGLSQRRGGLARGGRRCRVAVLQQLPRDVLMGGAASEARSQSVAHAVLRGGLHRLGVGRRRVRIDRCCWLGLRRATGEHDGSSHVVKGMLQGCFDQPA